MDALVTGLQFFAVVLPAVIGIAYVGLGFVTAWNPRVRGNTATVFARLTIGVGLLGLALFIASLFGWFNI